MGEISSYKCFVVKPGGGDHLRELVKEGRLVLKTKKDWDEPKTYFSNSPVILPLDLKMDHKFTKMLNSEMQGNMWDVKAKISTWVNVSLISKMLCFYGCNKGLNFMCNYTY